MPFKQLVIVSLKAIFKNKMRSSLTMLGVIIGVSSVILLLSLGSGLKTFVTGELEGLGSNLILVVPGEIDTQRGFTTARGGGLGAITTSKLELSDVKQIQDFVPEVLEASGLLMGSEVVKYASVKKTVQIIGTTSNFPQVRNAKISKGEFFQKGDVTSARRVIVLGANVANEYFLGIDPLGEKIQVGKLRYTVVGILEKIGGLGQTNLDDQAIIPITAAQRQFGKDNVNFIYVKVAESDLVDAAIPKIRSVLEKRLDEGEFTLVDQKEVLRTVGNILNVLTLALSGIAGISLVVGGVGIMNIMLVSVTERTREIGLRKALGATPKVILLQFLTEAILLSVGGGVIGILIGVLGSFALSQFMTITLTWWSIALAFAVSVGVGVIFGVMPARRASKLSPIEALRYE
jgi:putative ABC transport system permease protein